MAALRRTIAQEVAATPPARPMAPTLYDLPRKKPKGDAAAAAAAAALDASEPYRITLPGHDNHQNVRVPTDYTEGDTVTLRYKK